jgi:hypothetical protein
VPKVPSALVYDREGKVQKWGSQVNDLDKTEKNKIKSGEWRKCEWFKREYSGSVGFEWD